MFSALDTLVLAGMSENQIKKLNVLCGDKYAVYNESYMSSTIGSVKVYFMFSLAITEDIIDQRSMYSYMHKNNLQDYVNLIALPCEYSVTGHITLDNQKPSEFTFVSKSLSVVVSKLLKHLKKEKFKFDESGYLFYYNKKLKVKK